MYDKLMLINYSPGVALNRIYALYKVNGAELAIKEAEELKLEYNYFYFMLLGELYDNIDKEKAKDALWKAYSLAKIETEKEVIQKKIAKL